MDRIKVLVVSSVVPDERGSGGELVLYRHLKSNPEIQSEILSWKRFPVRLKVIGKLRELGFKSLSRAMECLFPVLPSEKLANQVVRRFQPDIIVTVAHGWWHIQARRLARRFGLPLVSFFQDWWPDFPEIPLAFRSRVEREFRKTCGQSDVAICVCERMRRELGAPENGVVIHDAPSLTRRSDVALEFQRPLRIAYFGNLSDYGPLVESALRGLMCSEQVRLEVFGPNPQWANGAEEEFRSRGAYHGFVASSELPKLLRDFHAVLVVMSFVPSHRRRMMTSFPSKLIDATQLALPIVIWGPEYCSAIRWARDRDAALCVTDPNPSALRDALEQLAGSPSELRRLAQAASDVAAGEFNQERIQRQFVDALKSAKERGELKG
jgi:glycosyltransferase involved in cell wall biosynthesis